METLTPLQVGGNTTLQEQSEKLNLFETCVQQLLNQKYDTKEIKLKTLFDQAVRISTFKYCDFLDWNGTLAAVVGYSAEAFMVNSLDKFVTHAVSLSENSSQTLPKAYKTDYWPNLVASYQIGNCLWVTNHIRNKKEKGYDRVQFTQIPCDSAQQIKISTHTTLEGVLAWKTVAHKEESWLIGIGRKVLVANVIIMGKDSVRRTSVKTSESVQTCLDVRTEGEALMVAFARNHEVYCLDITSCSEKAEPFANVDDCIQAVHLFSVQDKERLAVGEFTGQVSIFDRLTQNQLYTISTKIVPLQITYALTLNHERSLYIENGDNTERRLWTYEDEEAELTNEKMAIVKRSGDTPLLFPFREEFAGKLGMICENGYFKLVRLSKNKAFILTPNCVPKKSWFKQEDS